MNSLENAVAITSLGFTGVGVFGLWRFGLSDVGVSSLFTASICALAISLSFYVFRLRVRISAVEKQVPGVR